MARVVTARKQSSVNKLTRQSSVHSLMNAEYERESSNSRSFTARSSRFEGGRSSTYSNLTKSKLSQKFQNRMKVCFSQLDLQVSAVCSVRQQLTSALTGTEQARPRRCDDDGQQPKSFRGFSKGGHKAPAERNHA